MAQITGYQCDVCETFATDPSDWLKVTPYAKSGSGDTRSHIDVCSNQCLIKLGRERKGESPKRGPRKSWPDELKKEVVQYAQASTPAEAAKVYECDISLVARWMTDVRYQS